MYKEARYNLHMIIFYGKGVPGGNLLIRRNSSQNIAKLLNDFVFPFHPLLIYILFGYIVGGGKEK